jgi:AraC-like DNA-binding protein
MQRVGVLVEVPRIIRELGADPGRVLAGAGIHPEQLADAEGFIPYGQACDLIIRAAEATRRQDFAVITGARARIDHLGPLGRYLASATDLQSAISELVLYHPRYVRGGGPYLLDQPDGTLLVGYRAHDPGVHGAAHIAQGALSFGYTIFQSIGGSAPAAVLFSLPEPPEVSGYRSVFGSIRLVFNAPHFGLVFTPAALRKALPGALPALHAVLGKSIAERWGQQQPNIREQVLRALVPQVLSGAQSLELTAERLKILPQTLNRELGKVGFSFRDLLNEARFEMSSQLLTDAQLSISEITRLLGYSEISAFSRFFASMSGGVPPAEWRRQRTPGPSPDHP